MPSNVIKETEEGGFRGRSDRRISSGRVIAIDDVAHTAMLDVGAFDAAGTPIYYPVPYQPQNPPQVNDQISVGYTNSSPHSAMIGGGSVGGANPGGVVASVGGVVSLAKSGSAKLKNDVTLTGSGIVTLTQVGQNIDISASGGGGAGATLLFVNTSVPGGNTIASTTVDTAFSSGFTIAANDLAVGDVIRIDIYGSYGTAVIAPTLEIRLKIGGVTVATTTPITMVANVGSVGWKATILLIVDTIGGSGTFEIQGDAMFSTAQSTGLALLSDMVNGAVFTVDTTISEAVTLTAQWSASNAANTITLRQMVATRLR